MAKIHTHYDNLKVARLAPQEVIRAAYKALSQKYHPDKNPGDEKAARIMAILNSAYSTLADAQRRKEHDEWIAAEEWEIEWLESTHQDDQRVKGRMPAEAEAAPPLARGAWRDWTWWCGLAVCLGLGWGGAMLVMDKPEAMPPGLASAWAVSDAGARRKAEERAAEERAAEAKRVARAEQKAKALLDGWAVEKARPGETGPAPDIKVLAVSQLRLPAMPAVAVGCDGDAQAPLAPNGEAWPSQSGYLDGFPIGNKGDDLQLTVDNAANASPVFIKLYDLDRHANVRHLFLLAHEKFNVEQLAFGRYELRYQKIGPAKCAGLPVTMVQ